MVLLIKSCSASFGNLVTLQIIVFYLFVFLILRISRLYSLLCSIIKLLCMSHMECAAIIKISEEKKNVCSQHICNTTNFYIDMCLTYSILNRQFTFSIAGFVSILLMHHLPMHYYIYFSDRSSI